MGEQVGDSSYGLSSCGRTSQLLAPALKVGSRLKARQSMARRSQNPTEYTTLKLRPISGTYALMNERWL